MDKFTLYFFVFFAFSGRDVLCKLEGNQRQEARIIGGNVTDIFSYPYMAALEILIRGGGTQYCGGFIFDEDHIVTAGHCLKGALAMTVRIGSSESTSCGFTYITDSYKIHPKYIHNTRRYDVGVIKVKEGMYLDGPETQRIGMVESGTDVEEGDEMVVTGWGENEVGPVKYLHAVTLKAVDVDDCDTLYELVVKIEETMFCAGKTGKGVCRDDSGSPAVIDGKVVGVVTEPRGCARPDRPGIFTNLGHPEVHEWLMDTLNIL